MHLQNIMEKQHRSCNMKVVFLDIEKYSQRRTISQIDVIDAFSSCVNNALEDISKKYVNYAQENELNFKNDIIILPTGDGVGIIFSFEGLHEIHLSFALSLLNHVNSNNVQTRCEIFEKEGWCNCHNKFIIKIGISEGKGIIYKDINDRYNAAGGVVNMASRVMGMSERNQIMFTSEAFKQIVDMTDNANMVSHFMKFEDVEIKHKLKVNVFQYIDSSNPVINNTVPTDLVMKKKMKEITNKMKGIGLGIPGLDEEQFEKQQLVDFMERLANSLIDLTKMSKVIEIKSDDNQN